MKEQAEAVVMGIVVILVALVAIAFVVVPFVFKKNPIKEKKYRYKITLTLPNGDSFGGRSIIIIRTNQLVFKDGFVVSSNALYPKEHIRDIEKFEIETEETNND